MPHHLLRARYWATAALSVAAVAPVAAQSNVTLYGRLNTGIEYVDASRSNADLSSGRLSNYRSIWGLRGEEDLGGGLKAVFQVEGSIALDTGSGGVANRNSRLGLAGAFGTVFAGHWSLPYTLATSQFDPFYPTTAGYMSIMGNGSAPSTDHLADTSSFDRRQKNVLQYWSPTWAGASFRIAYSPSEGARNAAGGEPSLWSASVAYQTSALVLTAAHEIHREYQGASGSDTATKLGAVWRIGDARLAAVVERLRYETPSGELKRNAFFVSGTYQLTAAGRVLAAFTQAGDGKGSATETVGFFRSGADTGATQFTLGYEHALSRRTALFAFYSRINNEAAALYDFAINELGIAAGARPSVISVGMRHSF